MNAKFFERFDRFLGIKHIAEGPKMYNTNGNFAYVCETNNSRDRARISFISSGVGIIGIAECSCNPILTDETIMKKTIKFYEDFQF